VIRPLISYSNTSAEVHIRLGVDSVNVEDSSRVTGMKNDGTMGTCPKLICIFCLAAGWEGASCKKGADEVIWWVILAPYNETKVTRVRGHVNDRQTTDE
jgi:hypothetical protein